MYKIELNDLEMFTIKQALNIALYNSKGQEESDRYHQALDTLSKYKSDKKNYCPDNLLNLKRKNK